MAQLLWQVSPALLLAFALGWLVKSLISSKSIERLRAALSESQADAMRREAEVLTLNSRIQNADGGGQEVTRLRGILTAKDQEITALRDQLRQALEERSDTVTSAAARVEELDRLHSQMLSERDVEIGRLRRELETQRLEVTRLSTFVQALEPLSMQLSEAERDLTASVEGKNAEIARLTAQVAQLEAAMAATGIVSRRDPPEDLQQEIASLQAAVESKEAEVRRLTLLAQDLEAALRAVPAGPFPEGALNGDAHAHHEPAPGIHGADPGIVEQELIAAAGGRRIEFREGTAELEPGSRPVLDAIASVLRQYPEMPVEISGHTEEGPDFWFHYELSRRRAAAVKEYLAAKGVSAAALSETGCGQTRPIADNSSPEGRRANRRIEFRIAVEVFNAREIARTVAAAR